ncbi:hypothetical protein QBC39DRAFT_259051 [Podospora conica]|nr:hypothetical protein QBC39DRAFT_259051 [Schizothecium conicum]
MCKGYTPLLQSAMSGNAFILRYLCEIGASLDFTSRTGVSVFHLLGTWVHPEQVAYLSSLHIKGVDPDSHTHRGRSPIQLMESQADWSRVPGERTHRDAFAFCALIVEIRWRNWDSGQFLERKREFFPEGRRQRVYRWLGWKWQQLRDHPHLAEEKWGGTRSAGDGFGPLYQCEDLESVDSFCMDGLFGMDEDGEDSYPVPCGSDQDGYTSEDDEFFDVEE